MTPHARRKILQEALAEFEDSGITNAKFAKDIGVNPNTVTKWRAQKHLITPSHHFAAQMKKWLVNQPSKTTTEETKPLAPSPTTIDTAKIVEDVMNKLSSAIIVAMRPPSPQRYELVEYQYRMRMPRQVEAWTPWTTCNDDEYNRFANRVDPAIETRALYTINIR